MALSMEAQSFQEWKDPRINEVNRAPMHANYFAYESADAAKKGVKENSANFMSLNGSWKFSWVKDADARPTDFWKTGFDDKGWNDLPVPGLWELHGYGDPIYVNIGYAWRNQFKNNPPYVPTENNHVGSYRKEIMVPASWKGKDIIAHFGSVTSNMYLWVNGKYVGYSEDSKLEAEFNLTPYLKTGQKNLIAFQIFRWCDGTYLEDQDFFRYSGVGRDCYLYARDKKRIEDIRVTPDLDANYQNGSLNIALNQKGSGKVNLTLKDASGKEVATTQATKGTATLEVENPHKWTAETPYLYTLYASLEGSNEVIPVKVGFRKVELKNAQVLVNGQPILIKGANRHELDPDGGYVISKERMIQDIQVMKQFNLNAVRTCHYPDNNFWYELCDQYGIYVVAEANIESHGMGYGEETLAKREDYALAHMERNQRNVQRGFNHPSVIIWSLGNEAGYGPNFEAAYDWIKAEDPSRLVQYEQAGKTGKTDIYCPMYLGYDRCEEYSKDEQYQKPLIQCEYAHAMGNSEGGFKEYWDIIRKYPKYQGGFIWDFVDQSVRWTGKNGKMIYAYGGDFNRFDASDLNFCDNGLISPDRVPNPHMYEVGYFYQNIWTNPANIKNGEISIFNEYFFRDLSAYYLEWQLLKNGKIMRSGRVEDLNVGPQQTAKIKLPIGNICSCSEWLLNVAYKLKNTEGLLTAGHTVAKQQLVLNPYKAPNMELKNQTKSNQDIVEPTLKENDQRYLIVNGENFRIEFDKTNGYLSKYQINGLDMIKEGSYLQPNFWRAPTDNDFGAYLQIRYAVWKNPKIKLVSMQQYMANQQAIIEASYELPEVSAKLNLTYVINNEGAIKVTQKMTADKNAKVANLFRFGMQMQMPRSFDKVEYYGRGPVENYIDRKANADLGIYRQSVAEQFYSYIRPQETGTKSDLRWWKTLNAAGRGIQVAAAEPFSASALHYTIESLDEGTHKQQGHSPEVDEADLTNFCFDLIQTGLGCEDSWGRITRPEYQVPYGDYEFTFILKPM
jgi:beta-galactosidase